MFVLFFLIITIPLILLIIFYKTKFAYILWIILFLAALYVPIMLFLMPFGH